MAFSKADIIKSGRKAILLNVAGILFSGLIFPLISLLLTPQPAWVDADLFIKHYHPLQTATFFCGYFLICGSLLSFLSLYLLAEENRKIFALAGLLLNSIFSAVVILNYIIQTTYIPYLASYTPAETPIVLPVFTMANPGSLAWALEMYGWGGVGLSFILMRYIFKKEGRERQLRFLFLLNGVFSIAGAIMTSVDMNWIFSMAGLSALIIWNALVLIIDFRLLALFSSLEDINNKSVTL